MREHELRTLPVESLTALKRNPQYLTEKQMEALQTSIGRDGFVSPILVRPVDGGRWEIVSGNHRVMAARELGISEVPCVVAELDDRAAGRLAVNLNTVHGDPNVELMAPFLAELDDETLAEVHIDAVMLSEIMTFDEELRERLSRAEVPASLDHASPTSEIAQCVCPTCGKRHIRTAAE